MKKQEDIILGNRIKEIRIRLNYDQKRFAKEIGAPVSALSNWENGRNKPNMDRLTKIAQLGNISVAELLQGNDSEKYTNFFNKKFKNENKNNSELFRNIKDHEDNLRLIFKILTKNHEYTEDNAIILYNKAIEYILAIVLDYPISIFLSPILSTVSTIQSTWYLFNTAQRKELSLILSDLETIINKYSEEDNHIHFVFEDDYSSFYVN